MRIKINNNEWIKERDNYWMIKWTRKIKWIKRGKMNQKKRENNEQRKGEEQTEKTTKMKDSWRKGKQYTADDKWKDRWIS